MDEILREAFDCFLQESDEHLESAVSSILRLEVGFDEEAINALLRSFHTIKGNARMFELSAIPELAHAAESLASRVRSRDLPFSRGVADLFLRAIDGLRDLLSSLGSAAEGQADPGLLSALGAEAKGRAKEPAGKGGAAPLSEPAPQAATADSLAEAREPLKTPRDRSLAILLVEDDFVARRALCGLLADRGECDVTADGREAVAAVAEAEAAGRPYDLICVDLMLPGLDGFETVRAIRALELNEAARRLGVGGPKLRDQMRRDSVILITTSVDDPSAYLQACYRCGADGYIVKPVEKGRLLAELASHGLDRS